MLPPATNPGLSPAETFTISVNAQPDVSGPVDIRSTEPQFTILFDDLLVNASDPDQPLTVQNITSNDPDVALTILADRVEVEVPDAYVGTPILSYESVDSGIGPAVSQAMANLDIDTLQMEASGSVTNPDGQTRDRMDDVTGAPGGTDTAKATGGNDAVILDATTPYVDIEAFNMLGGDDYVDLSGAASGFSVDLGDGDDIVLGGDGDDVLTGGAGADTLTGGLGQDVFRITDLADADTILDFESPTLPAGADGDQIDLSDGVALLPGETLADHVGYDNSTGLLSVDGTAAASVGAMGGGVADAVEVIFTNATGAQETAVI